MALILTAKEGDDIMVGGDVVRLEEIVDQSQIVIYVNPDSVDSKDFLIEADKSVEISPSVFLSLGDRSNHSSARLVFEAPRSIKIERV